MRFWKLLGRLWRWSNTDNDRSPRRAAPLGSLRDSETLEDRSVPSAVFLGADPPPRTASAEVFQVSLGERLRQAPRAQNKVLRLSARAVDYLLEHDWFSLLTRPPIQKKRKKKRKGSVRVEQSPSGKDSDPTDESNRTVCGSDHAWSVVAPVDPPPGGSTTEAE